MAVGFPTKANWAAGDILTAAQMDDLAGTVNLLSTTVPRNPVLNSNASVWQRGTSIAISSTGAYSADRWYGYRGGATGNLTISRQTTADTTNLPNIQYCARVQRTAADTSTQINYITQSFETVNSIPFAGKAVAFSFYARAGANYSSASNALVANLYSGTGTDQNFITASYTGQATVAGGTATLTTTWQRFTFTGTVAATATELAIAFQNTPVGTAGANDYFEITGVQLELGSTASTYYPNGVTYQAELAACQRYYFRNTPGQTYGRIAQGSADRTTTATIMVNLPVTMRTVPSATVEWGNLQLTDWITSTVTATAVSLAVNASSPTTASLAVTVASGLTVNRLYFLGCDNNSAGYLGVSAEL